MNFTVPDGEWGNLFFKVDTSSGSAADYGILMKKLPYAYPLPLSLITSILDGTSSITFALSFCLILGVSYSGEGRHNNPETQRPSGFNR